MIDTSNAEPYKGINGVGSLIDVFFCDAKYKKKYGGINCFLILSS